MIASTSSQWPCSDPCALEVTVPLLLGRHVVPTVPCSVGNCFTSCSFCRLIPFHAWLLHLFLAGNFHPAEHPQACDDNPKLTVATVGQMWCAYTVCLHSLHGPRERANDCAILESTTRHINARCTKAVACGPSCDSSSPKESNACRATAQTSLPPRSRSSWPSQACCHSNKANACLW
jgi:hypothetical protein